MSAQQKYRLDPTPPDAPVSDPVVPTRPLGDIVESKQQKINNARYLAEVERAAHPMRRIIKEAGLTKQHIALIVGGAVLAVTYIVGVATYLTFNSSSRSKDNKNLSVPSDSSGHLETRFTLEPNPAARPPIPDLPTPESAPTIVE